MVADRDMWRLNFELLPRNPHGQERIRKKRKRNDIQLPCYFVTIRCIVYGVLSIDAVGKIYL